ncbi:MAG: hypothetical protein L3J34_10765 [Flavobacteriaceae bacterium]|nr:hypothetical protein [Flavobacteriaceae bacterium]
MSYKDKITEQFERFVLKSPKNKPKHLIHLHADFIELKTLFWAKDSWVTITDIITHYKDVIDSDIENDSEGNGTNNSDNDDKLKSKTLEIFDLIDERKNIFSDKYPFIIDEIHNRIKLKNDLTQENLLYLKLLLDSNLNNFSNVSNILTSEFETISAIALQNYLPNSTVEELGNNSVLKGNTKSKIKVLSKRLNVKRNKKEVKKLSKLANKEKGLDIIAYLPFEDKIASMIVVMAQCACGKGWSNKRGETESYESFLYFYKLRPIHSMFIPYGLTSNDNEGFLESDKLTNRLVFERKRIIENIQNLDFFNSLKSKEIVERCITFEYAEV